jgi:hypothetical protein
LSQENQDFTTAEVASALQQMATASRQAWQDALQDDALWKERGKQYGWLCTWLLRRQLKRMSK